MANAERRRFLSKRFVPHGRCAIQRNGRASGMESQVLSQMLPTGQSTVFFKGKLCLSTGKKSKVKALGNSDTV